MLFFLRNLPCMARRRQLPRVWAPSARSAELRSFRHAVSADCRDHNAIWLERTLTVLSP